MKQSKMKRKKWLSLACISAMAISLLSHGGGIHTVSAADTDVYTWTLTDQQTYLPPSGTNGGERHHQAIDNWRSTYESSMTSDDYIQIHVRNMLKNVEEPQSIDVYHECSQPKTSYKPGEKATLKMRAFARNANNYNYCRGSSSCFVSEENTSADGLEFGKFVCNNKNSLADFRALDSSRSLQAWDESSGTYIDANMEVTATMPESTTVGQRIAIVFEDNTGYDSISMAPQYEYGGMAFHLWIYTLKKTSSSSSTKITVGKAKITKISKIDANQFCVKWKKISNATGYQFQMSKTKSFKKVAYKGKNGEKYNYVNFMNVTKGTWYFRVRAYNKTDGKVTYGKWSAIKKYTWNK